MAKVLQIVNGVPRMTTLAIADSTYDETLVVNAGGITTGTPITLPNSGSYTGDELEVFLNGQFLEPVIDFNIEGVSPPYTQISLTFDVNEGERLRFRKIV